MTCSSHDSDAHFIIKDTETAGRGAFALTDLPAGTRILTTQVLAAQVVLREYRKEVCIQCFGYERGRSLKIRNIRTGHAFCSSNCETSWKVPLEEPVTRAYEVAESFVRKKLKQPKTAILNVPGGEGLPDGESSPPAAELIDSRWEAVEHIANLIRCCRRGSEAKAHKRAIQSTISLPTLPNHLSFLLSAVITRATKPKDWNLLMQLVPHETPYSSVNELECYICSYLQLLTFLPDELLAFATHDTVRSVLKRDSHNSFGIRSLDDGGDEFFGYAIWPEASFFNHSCDPNLSKRRSGRSWEFWVTSGIGNGQELTISYLGGEERELGVTERRQRLQSVWGFECGCQKCVFDLAEAPTPESGLRPS